MIYNILWLALAGMIINANKDAQPFETMVIVAIVFLFLAIRDVIRAIEELKR